jgi:hypothetical protein
VSDERTFAFIRTALKSVWDLELLLLLHRSGDARWTPGEIVRELRGSESVVSIALQSLKAARLIGEVSPNTYSYEPATDELHYLVNSVSQIYSDRPMAVIKAITEAPNDKLRAFSDAFKLRDQ